jgi:hypothetical protein
LSIEMVLFSSDVFTFFFHSLIVPFFHSSFSPLRPDNIPFLSSDCDQS